MLEALIAISPQAEDVLEKMAIKVEHDVKSMTHSRLLLRIYGARLLLLFHDQQTLTAQNSSIVAPAPPETGS